MPPHNVEAEQALLGAIILNNDAFDRVSDFLKPEHFSEELHRRTYEVIFTNDGSADRSLELLRAQHAARPDVTRVVDFNANYGQHMAIMAAFERVRGEVVVTLDADLHHVALDHRADAFRQLVAAVF